MFRDERPFIFSVFGVIFINSNISIGFAGVLPCPSVGVGGVCTRRRGREREEFPGKKPYYAKSRTEACN